MIITVHTVNSLEEQDVFIPDIKTLIFINILWSLFASQAGNTVEAIVIP